MAKSTTRSSRAAGRTASSARRDELVDIARRLFAEKGYLATSTRDIADAAGLLAGSLYSHFSSKAEILSLVVAPFYERLILVQNKILASDGPGVERLESMIREVLALCVAHPTEVQILHYDWPHLHANDELHDVVRASNRTLELWRELLRAAIADKTLRADLDPEIAMRMITSSLHAVADRQRYVAADPFPDERGLDWLTQQVLDTVLTGMRADPA